MDPLTMAAVQTGANALSSLAGSYLSRKDRRKAREMERLKRSAVQRTAGLGNQIADYSESVGTPEDALFYGGVAGNVYKDTLAKNKGAFGRELARRGVNPNSGAFMANFGGGAVDALGEANAYNNALFNRINAGVNARTKGQSALLRPFNAATSIQEADLARGQAKEDLFKKIVGGGSSSAGGAFGKAGANQNLDLSSLLSNIGTSIGGL